jgi:hypothetical protein
MLEILAYLDARFREPSTYVGIAAMLMSAHVSVDPGTMATVTLWGTVIAGAIAVLLPEIGHKPPMQIATDVLGALVAGIKAMPVAAPVASPVEAAPAPAAKAA